MDRHEEHPVETALHAVDAVRGLLGGTAWLAVALAFLVIGNTPGRLIGAAMLAVLVVPGLHTARKRVRNRSAKQD